MADQSYSISAMMGKKPDDVKQQKEERLHQQVDEVKCLYDSGSGSANILEAKSLDSAIGKLLDH